MASRPGALNAEQWQDVHEWLAKPKVDGGRSDDAPVHITDARGRLIAVVNAGWLRRLPKERLGPMQPPTEPGAGLSEELEAE